MISAFFIDRPIFAAVVSIVIVILGLVTLPGLPIEQTPNITPPTVSVTTYYPGASAQVLSETVALPLEREINGVEEMSYMSSKSSASDGLVEIIVTFKVGTDIDMATVLVQNRVSISMAKLPEEVKKQGVTTQKESTNLVLMVNLVSPDGSRVATSSFDGALRVWSAADGTQLFRTRARGISGPRFSPDGSVLLAVSGRSYGKDDSRPLRAGFDSAPIVGLWNAADGTLLRKLRAHTDKIMSARFSPDGTRLAMRYYDRGRHVVTIRDTATAQELVTFDLFSDAEDWTPPGGGNSHDSPNVSGIMAFHPQG